jgi:hypothetical protein
MPRAYPAEYQQETAMNGHCGHGPANVLQGAPFDLDVHSAAKRAGAGSKLVATSRDLMLIALAWMIFFGVILHPAVQLVGIAACALALLVGGARSAFSRRAEI